MIRFKHKGNFEKTESFLQKMREKIFFRQLDKYGRRGVEALAAATPVDTGKTRDSWKYRIDRTEDSVSIVWLNDNVEKGIPIAIILDCGHATGTGGYVAGRHYISPAIEPIYKEILEKVWKEVTES